MSNKFEVYKCEHCGNIVELLAVGDGTLVCCGHNMTLLEEKTADSSTEKHVPFIEEIPEGYKVRIGENTEHPMTEEHFIQWIELITSTQTYIQFLKPNDKPEAIFKVDHENDITAREYCNIHGLWKSEKKS